MSPQVADKEIRYHRSETESEDGSGTKHGDSGLDPVRESLLHVLRTLACPDLFVYAVGNRV